MLIAVLEDDPTQAEFLSFWLRNAHYDVELFAAGADLLAQLGRQPFDLFVVDWILPDTSGDQVITDIRERLGWDVPILVATSRDGEDEIVEGLSVGADDYLCKPIKPKEFIARIETLLRRFKPGDSPLSIQYAIFELNRQYQQVRREGQLIDLTQKEFDLAWYLFSNPGRLFSRMHLLHKIWGRDATDMDTRTLDTHVSRLRRKLLLDADACCEIRSVYGYGYRLQLAPS